ncbi:MAG: hypothetical protein GTO42_03040 [Candidatus Latescibacteria bacterium]|nr:hypothetical protein [Candidatus Latescibacterota bacterium]NIO01112.1 hypothetical protein [Candidatus Latescibacterota bacterium]NIO77822.1 hypothetical protein [Candidatus Latescibacterota bacterium]
MSMRESPLPFTRNSGQSSEEAEAFSSKLKNIYEAVGTVVQGQLLNVIPYQFQEEYRYYLKAADIYPENRAIQRFKDLAESRALILLGGESLERERCNEALGYYEMFGFLRDRFLCATVRGSRKYIYD